VDAIYFTQSVFRVVFPFLLLFYLFFSAVDAKLKRGLYENVVAYLTVQRVVFRRQVCNLMVDFVPEAWNTG
jgi:hypothetical protein